MSESDLADRQRVIAAALDELDRLYEEAAAAIDQIADPDLAFKRATEFAATTHQFHDKIADRLRVLRARQAARIRDREALSLAELGERISMSKARADQLVRYAKAKGEPS